MEGAEKLPRKMGERRNCVLGRDRHTSANVRTPAPVGLADLNFAMERAAQHLPPQVSFKMSFFKQNFSARSSCASCRRLLFLNCSAWSCLAVAYQNLHDLFPGSVELGLDVDIHLKTPYCSSQINQPLLPSNLRPENFCPQ